MQGQQELKSTNHKLIYLQMDKVISYINIKKKQRIFKTGPLTHTLIQKTNMPALIQTKT